MNESQGAKERYLALFARLQDQLPGVKAPWLRDLRAAAAAGFAESGFPTPAQEAWKYTSVAPVERRSFDFTGNNSAELSAEHLRAAFFDDFDAHTLTFVDGRFAPRHSRTANLPDGVTISALADVLARSPSILEPYLGRYADTSANGFVALNTAFMSDGAYVHVPQGVDLDLPLHLAFVLTGPGEIMAHPRVLIVAEPNSRVTVVEHYTGGGTTPSLTNAVTEIVAGRGAQVMHYKLQREASNAYHIATIRADQSGDSLFTSRNFSLGGRLTRNDITTVLREPGGECTLDGLYMADGRRHVDNHTLIDHAAASCSSREYYKGVLDERARGVFNGRIVVRQDAQRTDAHQSNHNLLLSQEAEVDTKPQLEIYADDVRCTHGATVGHLDQDALFYLRTRGIDATGARGLLTYAFAREVVDRLEILPLRTGLQRGLLGLLPGIDESVGEFL